MIYREKIEEGYKPVIVFATGMLDVMDFERSSMILIEHNLYDLFLDMEVYCTTQDRFLEREQLI